MKKNNLSLLAISLVFIFSSCASIENLFNDSKGNDVAPSEKNLKGEKPKEKPQSSAKKEAEKLAFAEKSLDILIEAVKNDDYNTYFSRFSRDHKDLIKEADFKERNKSFREQCGEYQSRKFIGVLKKQLFDVYLWKAKYSKLPKDEILLRLFVVEEDGKLSIYAFNIQPF